MGWYSSLELLQKLLFRLLCCIFLSALKASAVPAPRLTMNVAGFLYRCHKINENEVNSHIQMQKPFAIIWKS